MGCSLPVKTEGWHVLLVGSSEDPGESFRHQIQIKFLLFWASPPAARRPWPWEDEEEGEVGLVQQDRVVLQGWYGEEAISEPVTWTVSSLWSRHLSLCDPSVLDRMIHNKHLIVAQKENTAALNSWRGDNNDMFTAPFCFHLLCSWARHLRLKQSYQAIYLKMKHDLTWRNVKHSKWFACMLVSKIVLWNVLESNRISTVYTVLCKSLSHLHFFICILLRNLILL